MKVLVIAGSPRPEKSVSLEAARRAVERLDKNIDAEIETDIITVNDANIESCCGCMSCFSSGRCPLEKKDSMAQIKFKMLNADLIIFATPIYAGNVSIFMNVLFQRLSGWLHLMPLIGKRAVLLTSSCGNGIYMVNNYMKNIAWGFGMRVISVLNVIAREKADLDNEYNSKLTEKCAKLMGICIKENTSPDILNKGINEYFDSMKGMIALSEDDNKYEYEQWKESGLLLCESFEEAENLVSERKMASIPEV